MWGEIIGSIGGSLIGGLMGKSSQKSANRLAAAQFERQQTQTIQDRVADARKAGIHPLYAIGATSTSSPTAHVDGSSPMGTALAEGISRAGRAFDARAPEKRAALMDRASIQESVSRQELNYTQRQYYAALTAKALQEVNAAGAGPLNSGTPGTFTNPLGKLRVNKDYTTAEEWENQYGGVVGEVAGILNYLSDQSRSLPPWLDGRKYYDRTVTRNRGTAQRDSDYISP